MHHRTRHCRAGFTLAESVVSIVIVGIMFVAALNTVAVSRVGQFRIDIDRRGTFLAQEIMTEILEQDYEDPWTPTDSNGAEVGDAFVGRIAFDDVDDYNGWISTPPVNRRGDTIDGFDGWTRSVTVTHVLPDDLDNTQSSRTGMKRITVEVRYNDVVAARLECLRSRAWSSYNAGEAVPLTVSDMDELESAGDAVVVGGGTLPVN